MQKIRIAFFTASFLFFSAFSLTDAEAQIGFWAGANYGSLSDITLGDEKASFEAATGYHVGVTYELSLVLLTIRPGIFYRQFGEITFSGDDVNADSDLDDLNLTFIDVPIDVLIRLGIIPIVKPYLLVGPVFNFPSASDSSLDEAFKSFATSLGLGAGITFSLAGLSVTPEFRYEFGISDLVEPEFDFEGGPTLVLESDPPSSYIIRVGVGF